MIEEILAPARKRFKNEHLLKEMRIEDDDVDRLMAHFWKPVKPHPYCTQDMMQKLLRQREAMKKAGIDMNSPLVQRRIQRGDYKLPRPDFHLIHSKTWCDKCDRQAQTIEIEMYDWNRWYKINIWCHGQQESYEITEIEYLMMMKDLKRAYVFFDPVKQIARDWVTQTICSIRHPQLEMDRDLRLMAELEEKLNRKILFVTNQALKVHKRLEEENQRMEYLKKGILEMKFQHAQEVGRIQRAACVIAEALQKSGWYARTRGIVKKALELAKQEGFIK